MPFEPRLYRLSGDEERQVPTPHDPLPAGALESEALALPDHLVELAAQLTADADHLARCCPAPHASQPAGQIASEPEPPRSPSRGFATSSVRWAAAMLLLGTVCWGTLQAVHRNRLRQAAPIPAVASEQEQTIHLAARMDLSLPAGATGPGHMPLPPDRVPAALGTSQFEEFSGAEQEAVLDLWEQQAIGNRSLSI